MAAAATDAKSAPAKAADNKSKDSTKKEEPAAAATATAAAAAAAAGAVQALKVYVKEVTKESFTVIPARVTDTAAKLCEIIAKKRGIPKEEAKEYSLWLQNSDPNDPFEQKLSPDECPLEIADVLKRYEQIESFKWFYSRKKKPAGIAGWGADGDPDEDDEHNAAIMHENDDHDSGNGTSAADGTSDEKKKPGAGSRYGYLSKRGVRNTGWKERWFMLEHGKLAYFRSKEHASPISSIVVTDADIVPLPPLVKVRDGRAREPEYPFNVHTPDRIFYLKSRSQRDMHEWVHALKKHTGLDAENAIMDSIQVMCDEQQIDKADADEKFGSALRTLEGCLKNAVALDHFLHFLQVKRTEENLLFWSAAEEFRVRKRSPAERKLKGTEIFEKYIQDSAEFDIGAKPADRATVKAAIEKGDETAFAQLQGKAFSQLEADAFPSFLASDSFKKLIVASRLPQSFKLELDEV